MARLIDAEIFIRDLTAMKKMYDAIELDGMIKALKEAPTIDPVRHGKWIISSDGYYPYCSECHYRPEKNMTNYCPNCGARMDKECE